MNDFEMQPKTGEEAVMFPENKEVVENPDLAEKNPSLKALLAYRKRNLYQLRERYGLWEKDDKRLELVEKIVKRLAAQINIGLPRVVVSNSPEINAWALCGLNEIDFRAGLIRSLGEWCARHGQKMTEDKIAMILAHELSHIEQKTEEEKGQGNKTEWADSQEKQQAMNNEYDADRRGLVILAQAGYNPREGIEAVNFLQSLGEKLPFFNKHPRSADRIRELYEMVESSDTFLPNINKNPEEIAPDLYEALVREPEGKPGTIVYREAGRKKLGEIARGCENFYDVVEIANIARMHDIARLAKREKERPENRKRKAEKMVLENISTVLSVICELCKAVSRKYGDVIGVDRDYNWPKESSTYIDLEFNYEDGADLDSMLALRRLPEENLSNEKYLAGGGGGFEEDDDDFKEYKKKSDWDNLKEEIQKMLDLIDGPDSEECGLSYFINRKKVLLPNATQGWQAGDKLSRVNKKIKILEETRKKLLEFKEKIDQVADRINENTIDQLLANVEIQRDEKIGGFADSAFAREFVEENSTDALLDWCLSNGTAYFSNHYEVSAEDISSGIVKLDLFYENYLPEEYTRKLDLGSPEDRRLFVERSIFDVAFRKTKDKFESYLSASGSGEALRLPHLEQVLDVLKERFVERYALILRPENARKFADIVINGWLEAEYPVPSLAEFAQKISHEECVVVLKDLLKPVVEIQPSANQIFEKETEINSVMNFDFFTYPEQIFYGAVLDRVRAEGEGLPSPEDRLLKYREMYEKGDLDKISSVIEKDLIKIISESDYKTALELHAIAGPFLEESKYYRKGILVEGIVREGVKNLDPKEVLKFYKMENYGYVKMWEYFQEVWHDENRKKASLQEQLEFFEAFLEVLPFYDEYGGYGRFRKDKSFDSLDYKEQKKVVAKYYFELNREYFDLCRQVHPGAGILEPLKRLLKDGFLGFDEDKSEDRKNFLSSPELTTELMSLSGEEWVALAKYCAEIDGKQKSSPDIARNSFGPDPRRMDKELVERIYRKALAYFNGGSFNDYFKGSKNRGLKENIGFILEHVPRRYRDEVFREFFKKKETEVGQFELVESESIWPGGAASALEPIAEKAGHSSRSLLQKPDNIEENAKRYNPKRPSFLTYASKNFDTSKLRIDLLKAYFETKESGGKGIIEDDSLSLTERMNIIFKLVPEKTDFRDWLFAQLEGHFFNVEWGILTQGPLIDIKNWKAEDQEIAKELYDFYEQVIPTMVDAGQEQIWSRRAYELYCGLFADEKESFKSRLGRILKLYPEASYVRDEVLLRLGDSDVIKTPEQSKEILSFLFASQRRTADKKVLEKQSQLEQVSGMVSMLSRRERKDFILWCIGADPNPPLLIRAIGGQYWVSFEDLPGLIFSGTPAERAEFFTRLLYGGNGVLDPRAAEQKEIFDELLEFSFEKMFPEGEGGLDEKGRDIIKTIFTVVMNEYEPYRRSKIFISMMEVLRGESGSSIARRARRLLEEMGPVFIKAAQVLSEEEGSGRPLLPEEFREEFKKTKQDVKTFHRSASFQTLEAVGEFTESRDNKNPIVRLERLLAAASIKQGYIARQKDGSLVAEMVRRPSIGKYLEEDLRVLSVIVGKLKEKTEVPDRIDTRIARFVRDESDFEQEVLNYKNLNQALASYEANRKVTEFKVRLPEIYSSGNEHIRMEYISGLTLEDLAEVNSKKISIEDKLKERGLGEEHLESYKELLGRVETIRLQVFDSLMYQMLRKGSFHSDLHAGNIIITPEKEVVLIDLGSAGKVEEEKIPGLREFFGGFVFGNGELVKMSLEKFVPGLTIGQQKRIMETIENSKLDNRDKFNRILIIISEGGRDIDSGFEKFLKGLATGSYLSRGLDEEKLAASIFAYI